MQWHTLTVPKFRSLGYFDRLTLCCRSLFCNLVPKGGFGSPSYISSERVATFDAVSVNGGLSKLDFDHVQLMNVSEPESRGRTYTGSTKQVWQLYVSASIQDTNGNLKTKPAFLWSMNTKRLMWTLCNFGVCRKSKLADQNRKKNWNNAITQLLYNITTQFQRLHPHLRGPATW